MAIVAVMHKMRLVDFWDFFVIIYCGYIRS